MLIKDLRHTTRLIWEAIWLHRVICNNLSTPIFCIQFHMFSKYMCIRQIWVGFYSTSTLSEPHHDKTNEMACAPSEDSDQPGHPTSLIKVFACALWVAKDPSFLHADSKDSDQTGRMPRLIWIFAEHTAILLVLSSGGSFHSSFQAKRRCIKRIHLALVFSYMAQVGNKEEFDRR